MRKFKEDVFLTSNPDSDDLASKLPDGEFADNLCLIGGNMS